VVRKVYRLDKSQAILQTSIDISGFSAGVYFVRIQMGSCTVTKKIVKI
jgi:hypothetical protein